jgi:hydroxymethylpyrimidine ABC superfamily ATP binding cassette transporter, binding protein
MEHPEEAAEILIKYAPELENKKAMIIESQKYLATQYASDKDKWGYIDPTRWNAFYNWLNEKGLTKNPIPENTGFSNDYLE